MAESLPVQLLLGVYLGVLTGVLPALVSWALGFSFRYVTGVTVPGLAVVVLGTALAGISGGLMGLLDPAVAETWVSVVALLVVMMGCLWAHDQGDEMGAEFPRRLTLGTLRDHTLPRDVVERVGRFGQVRVRIRAPIGDVEGYPSLPDDVRRRLRADAWTFPADLPIPALESRLATRLRREYDLADVTVSIDDEGMATVAAAPAPGGLSRRVPEGKRGVSIETLVPTGLARGDRVRISLPERTVEATVLSVTEGTEGHAEASESDATDDTAEKEEPERRAAVAAGGEGRVTVTVPSGAVADVLESTQPRLTAYPRGTRREFDLVALLGRAGVRFASLQVGSAGLAGTALEDRETRERHGVALLGVRHADGWRIAPRGDVALAAGDELLVAGPVKALRTFEEVVA
ncbi:TrkA C-terminal domain-containing protein [Halalkalicoccus ordinarius]|uniref:TrkA C-terminal domain-containing protein n=1 Tax=Halalkalicoccus ordinarius TaxID=3116651 RepID=UPI00300F6759